MTEDSAGRIQRGDVVQHSEYGEVEVLDFDKRVRSISTDGVDYEILVKFTTAVGSQLIPEHRTHWQSKRDFLKVVRIS